MYYPDVYTERKLNKLEQRIHDMYSEASQEMATEWAKYINGYDETIGNRIIHHKGLGERVQEEYQKYIQGDTGYNNDAEFYSWVQTQVQRGEGYSTMTSKLASRAMDADLVASAYINDTTPSIYSLNANYEAYRISQAFDNVDFQLTDEQTVRRLMGNDNHIEFKTARVNPTRDYEWNRAEIHKALTSGILQGKSIDKLTDDFLRVMKRDENSARRNARTAVTSAQNAGRLETYYRAEQMGIEIYKEWISSHDGRVRETHGQLDGERVPYNSLFSNGLRYPADVEGAPEEVYNCRCSMRAILPNINDEKRKTYKDWLAEQEDKQDNETLKQNISGENYKEISTQKGKFKDITEKALSTAVPNNEPLQYNQYVECNNTTYYVDGNNVILKASDNEIRVAKLIQTKLGKKVEILPEVRGKYKDVKTADYLIDGVRHDLKEINNSNPEGIRNAIHKHKGQADDFIIDITNAPQGEEFYIEQAEKIFSYYNTMFVNSVTVVKGEEIIKILTK